MKFCTRGAIPISVVNNKTPEKIYEEKDSYKPFNLVSIDLRGSAMYICNPGLGCEGSKEDLCEGVHCVSNHSLNGEWNKVQKLRNDLKSFLESNPSFEPEDVMQLLLDDVKLDLNADVKDFTTSIFVLPMNTEIGGKSFTVATVCSTVILVDYNDEVKVLDRKWENGKDIKTERSFQYTVKKN